jgi:DNA-binding response OmpR family regulator
MPDTTLLHGKKVLVVDDEPDILNVLEEILDMCEVTKASTFEEARKLLEREAFDLAILDIMGVNGYKLLNIAKQRNITAIMLTANALSSDNLVKSIKGGADSYLPKEEVPNITTFLIDILKSQDEGESPWESWHRQVTASHFDRKWGPDWKEHNREFWEKFTSGKIEGTS